MAKRGRPIVHYAEELGRIVGAMRGRAENWNEERQRLIKRLSSVVGEAQNLLSDLGHRAGHEADRVAFARPRVLKKKAGTPRKRRNPPTAANPTARKKKK
jgi:predicted Rossmann fold nucleotide-binding protein DprA/Smf involved in DNA uptake